MMYYKGDGVPRDLVLAYQWVSLAANKGNKEAIKGRKILVNILSVEQLRKGERLVRKWTKNNQRMGRP